ncbi:MAG: hypothetical protein Harvfovirus43_14 [Harvfovirus sp.]|uniref:CMP/dCMP-type deaminase domain-containing protein n=1 Tax=Harvfovirus sp. TaxID=2487768 RepID=A0A3G5A2Z5_9VIRU|nr:MAG: hypothetical protein Harvfovirus43_14 [Harvfovirus sp.]
MTDYFIESAIAQALKSPMDKKYGAVLIHRGKIISSGFNKYRRGMSSKVKDCIL